MLQPIRLKYFNLDCKLYLIHAQSRMLHGQVGYDILSRCLDDLLRELLKLVNAKRNSAANSMKWLALAYAKLEPG
jgi:hypothetical protein